MLTKGQCHLNVCIHHYLTFSTTTLQDKQQPEIATTEKEQIQLELQVMTKKWCRQKRENQQLQQELLAPKTTRRDDSQRQVSDMIMSS